MKSIEELVKQLRQAEAKGIHLGTADLLDEAIQHARKLEKRLKDVRAYSCTICKLPDSSCPDCFLLDKKRIDVLQ